MNPHVKPTGRQHCLSKPCSECPFARATPQERVVKMVDPLALIGQSIGPFALPCHSDSEYRGKQTDMTRVSQCAGAAIYRANVGVAWKFPAAFHSLKENKILVFGSAAELLAKFKEITIEQAEELLKVTTPDVLLAREFADANVRLVVDPKA